MLVSTATAVSRMAADWTDTEGFEISSQLVPLAQAATAVKDEPASLVYIALLDPRLKSADELGPL